LSELISPIHILAKFSNQLPIPNILENIVLKISQIISKVLDSSNTRKLFLNSEKSHLNIIFSFLAQLLEGNYKGKLTKPLLFSFLEIIGKLFRTSDIFVFSILKNSRILQSFSKAVSFIYNDAKILNHIVDSLLDFCYSTLAISHIESHGLLSICIKRLTERYSKKSIDRLFLRFHESQPPYPIDLKYLASQLAFHPKCWELLSTGEDCLLKILFKNFWNLILEDPDHQLTEMLSNLF
jgi:hypothetical protein